MLKLTKKSGTAKIFSMYFFNKIWLEKYKKSFEMHFILAKRLI